MFRTAVRKTVTTVVIGAGLVTLSLSTAACGGKADEGSATAPKAAKISRAATKAADAKWKQLCVSCHGDTGKGDGAAAKALDPKPRSFADGKWQASVTDEHLAKIIVEGGPAVKLSALMPPNPDLKTKPEVVKALVAKVRSFKK